MKSQPTKNTLLKKRTSQRCKQFFLREYFISHPKRNSIFFSTALRCFNFFATHSRHDKTAKPTADKAFNYSTDRTPAGNSGFAKKRVQWLIEHSTSHQILWYVDSLVLRNPLLRKAANRQAVKKPCIS